MNFKANGTHAKKGKSMRKNKKQRESTLVPVKKEHPKLSRAVQESIARATTLLRRSKRLGDWELR
jgi:hypothetical protein